MKKIKVGDLVEIVADHSVNCGQICEVLDTSWGIVLDGGIGKNGKKKKIYFQNEESLRIHTRKGDLKKSESSEKIFLAVMYEFDAGSKERINRAKAVSSIADLDDYLAFGIKDSDFEVFCGTVDEIKEEARLAIELTEGSGMFIVFDNRVHLMYIEPTTKFINLEKESV